MPCKDGLCRTRRQGCAGTWVESDKSHPHADELTSERRVGGGMRALHFCPRGGNPAATAVR